MSEPGKAVFLSYASQDAEAAKRICESLRAAGVEVWFDADGGLEHGDEWDRKIRRQIKECVLFLPIISTNTQAREEGYFRIEWDLAAERARGIASGVAYILPVVIDDTREPDALVPDRFRAVQWTRLPGGVVPPDVLQRFLKLWSHRTGALKHAENVGRDLRIPPPSNEAGFGDPALQKKQKKRRLWLIPVIAALAVAAGLWQQQRNRAKIVSSEPEGQAIAPAAPLSPARQLAAKSAKLHDQLENASRSDLELAEQYCQQAVALDPNDGELWAEYSLVNSNFIALGYDRSNERIQATRTQADRAVKLAPESNEAEFALATSYRWQGAMRDEAINRLRKLVERMPGDRRVLRTLGNALRLTGKSEEALLWYTRAAALPGGDPLALFQRAMALEALGRNEEAAVTVDESLAQHPGAAAHILKVLFLLRWGELDQARLTLDKVPAPFLLEDRGALAASMVFYRQRQWDRGLGALLAVPHDYFDDTYYRGPKGLLTGDARFYAGRKIAAELDWRAALQLVNQRLAGTKDTALLHLRKAELHARLGEADEADRALRAFRELQGGGGFLATARIELWLKRNEAALQSLQAYEFTREVRVMLRQDPEWDPLRGDPRFQALLVEPAAPSPSSLSLPPSGPPPPDQKSVAVLAFANLSDDKANEYFSDGISEELLNVLAKVPKLKVAARTSSFHF